MNKIFASLLIPGIAILLIANVVDILYHPDEIKSDYTSGSSPVQVTSSAVAEEFDILKLLANADIEKGKATARSCAPCHTFNKGEANKIGPNLYGIVNAKKAHSASFKYSKAMSAQTGTWTEEELANYLRAPQKVVPGTKMSFAGITKNSDLVNVIAYLKTLSESK